MTSFLHTPSNAPADANAAAPLARHGPTAKALVLGAAGAALTAVLVTQAEMVLSTVRIGYLQFPPVALGILLLATALGRSMRRLSARWGLSSSELLVIYCMALVAAMVSSHGIVERFIPLLIVPKYFANSANDWHTKFDLHIPQRLVPYDVQNGKPQAVAAHYFTPDRAGAVPWAAWAMPVLNWSILIVLVLGAFLCLTAILRRQWVDNEKLPFPLVQLPLEIAADGDGQELFFRNPVMWLGVLLPVIVFGIKAVHQVMPTVPDPVLQTNLSQFVTAPPWNQVAGGIIFTLSFAAVGFFFLLPSDMLLSVWFFFLLTRVQIALGISANMNMPRMPIYPLPLFVGYQTIGAYFVLTGYFLWIARPHLRRVWAAALGREADDIHELLPYRAAVWGLLGCVLLSALWLWGMGMSLWLAIFEIVVFVLLIALVMARTTAEAGMLMTETTFRPIDIYRMVAPIHALGAQNLTLLAFVDNLLLRDQRGLLLCGMLDTARLADGAAAIQRRKFVGILALGIGVAFVVAVLLNIAVPYHFGAGRMDPTMEQASPQRTFQDYAAYFGPSPPPLTGASWQMPTFFGVGALVALVLTLLRTAFFWWPLQPLGYAIAGSWSTIEFWFPCFLAWIFKSITLRYGGMGAYARVRPFFLGLIVGEFSMAVLAVLLNIFFHLPPPDFPWG